MIFWKYKLFLKRGVTWNHPETTWNHLKPATLLKWSYSQVVFVPILHPKVCFGKFNPKNWSSSNWLEFGTEVDCCMLILILMFINLKFSKLTEIWYRGTLLYAYYNFYVYFFQNSFHSYFFGANLTIAKKKLLNDKNFVKINITVMISI